MSKLAQYTSRKLSYIFSGLVDFSDMTSSKYIFEVATFQMFMMISAQTRGYDVIKAAVGARAGFERVMSLNADEKRWLHLCVMARVVITIVLCAFSINENNLHKDTQISVFYNGSCDVLKALCNNQLRSLFDPDAHFE